MTAAYRMFSPPALHAFKHFCEVDRRTRSRIQGAHDAMPEWQRTYSRMSSAQKAEMRRQVLRALDATEPHEPPEWRRGSGKAATDSEDIDERAGENPDPETLQMIMKALEEKFGGDTAGSFAKFCSDCWPGSMGATAQDEPPDFAGKPKTGGTMVAQDARFVSDAEAEYFRAYPMARRLGLDPCPR